MLRPGHASTMTLGIYETPPCASTSRSTSPAYTYDTRPNTPSQHLTIYLSDNDPTDALFYTSTGKKLYQSRTAPFRIRSGSGGCSSSPSNHSPTNDNSSSDNPYSPTPSTSTSVEGHAYPPLPLITRVSRLYGSTAHAVREASLALGDVESAAEGLLIAEMEWLGRTSSSRIRFGDGLAVNQQNAVDVRVDEFLKSTNGRGFSKMFATPDGRTYKWKTDAGYSRPAELVECDGGKRVSGPLVTFRCQDGDPDHGGEGEGEGEGEEDGDGQRKDGSGPVASLRVATRLLPVIDQVLVSWVIMERERRLMASSSSSPRSSSSSSSASSR